MVEKDDTDVHENEVALRIAKKLQVRESGLTFSEGKIELISSKSAGLLKVTKELIDHRGSG